MEALSNSQGCLLCPRFCGSNREKGQKGACGVSATLKVARAALHFWEEPCISGTSGSGAVFFSGCSLHCVFCQNRDISDGIRGREITEERLCQIFFELKDKGANNINLVTAGHFLPQLVRAIEKAKRQGFDLPFIYNSSSYETVESLKRLEGLIDVYLPDYKYHNPVYGKRYSRAEDYPEVARAAITEMVRQQGSCLFYAEGEDPGSGLLQTEEKDADRQSYLTEAEDGYLIRRGVIVRQLLLPGLLADAERAFDWLYDTFGDSIYISLMSQYTPMPGLEHYPELKNKVRKKDYDALVDHAIDRGLEHGFIQEGDTAEESFIPPFDLEGV